MMWLHSVCEFSSVFDVATSLVDTSWKCFFQMTGHSSRHSLHLMRWNNVFLSLSLPLFLLSNLLFYFLINCHRWIDRKTVPSSFVWRMLFKHRTSYVSSSISWMEETFTTTCHNMESFRNKIWNFTPRKLSSVSSICTKDLSSTVTSR